MISVRDLRLIIGASRGHAVSRFGAEGAEVIDALCDVLEAYGDTAVSGVINKLKKPATRRKASAKPLDDVQVDKFVRELRAAASSPAATGAILARLAPRSIPKPEVLAIAKMLGLKVTSKTSKPQVLAQMSAVALQNERDRLVAERIRKGA